MRILICGDYCPVDGLKPVIERGDYVSVFEDVMPYTAKADFSIVNMECPVAQADYKPIHKLGPHLRTTHKAIEALKFAGFDAVTLANNHAMDYGETGLMDTVNALQRFGLQYVGISVGGKTLTFKIEEKTLAIINCCEHEFSVVHQRGNGCTPLDPILQYKQIMQARANADYVLVIVHGGHEHFRLPSPRMVETYRWFIDLGADAVVNHHQHCFSGYESYKGKPIFYGLGNFCFHHHRPTYGDWHKGYMLELEFDKTQVAYNLVPYIQCWDKMKVTVFKDKDVFTKELEELNAIIADEQRLRNAVNEYYERESKNIASTFYPYANRYLRKLCKIGLLPSLLTRKKCLDLLNHIECEAHRDKTLYWLHQQIHQP